METPQDVTGEEIGMDSVDQLDMELHPDSLLESGQLEDEFNFADMPEFAHLPPLDPWRKMKREVLKFIGETRNEDKEIEHEIFADGILSEAAKQYADFVLEDMEDEEKMREIMKANGLAEDLQFATALTMMEEDHADINELAEDFQDAHGLLIETDRAMVMNHELNHVGLGLAAQDMRICLVEIFNNRDVAVLSISDGEEGGVDVRGKMLNTKVGLYAISVVERSNRTRSILSFGPEKIQLDLNSGHFYFTLPIEDGVSFDADHNANKIIEFYVRGNPDRINYGEADEAKLNLKHLTLTHKCDVNYYPDPRMVIEDTQDDSKLVEIQRAKLLMEENKQAEALAAQAERDAVRAAQREELQRAERERQAALRDQDTESQSGSIHSSTQRSGFKREGKSGTISHGTMHSQDRSDSKSDISSKEHRDKSAASHGRVSGKAHDSKQPSMQSSQIGASEDDASDNQEIEYEEDEDELEVSQKEVKEELLLAIADAISQHEEQIAINKEQQRKVIQYKQKNEVTIDKGSDMSMNQHKYLNTLANVHQVRFKLRDTQDQYNRMANELEEKLYEKQEKCLEIRNSFREFKREVARNAEYNRTGKPIPKKIIDDWEHREGLKDKEVQDARLQNIRLRNNLETLEKSIKKKEEFIHGVHLIDFEQLKIENQTLNEKIEERNEELHKLRKKIVKTVEILTHTREKLDYVKKQKKLRQKIKNELVAKENEEKTKLTKLKKKRDAKRTANMRSKQETGIVNSTALTDDLEERKTEITGLKDEYHQLQDDLFNMQTIINKSEEIRENMEASES